MHQCPILLMSSESVRALPVALKSIVMVVPGEEYASDPIIF